MLPVRSITNAYFIFNEECFSVIKGEEEMEEEEERERAAGNHRVEEIEVHTMVEFSSSSARTQCDEHQRRNLPDT